MDMSFKNHKTIYIKGMLCNCCKRLLELVFEKEQIPYLKITLGQVTLPQDADLDYIKQLIQNNGLQLIEDKNLKLVEQIKIAVIELIYYANNSNSIIRNSDYLVGKTGFSYPYLSSLFSEYEGLTLEKFIIQHKIEKTKELLQEEELTLSEIAYQMGYSSVQYLSNQFKKITGMTVSEWRKTD
jgi:AraC-like DNA-binding protein